MATSDDEQAVSSAIAGPSRSSAKGNSSDGRVEGGPADRIEAGGRLSDLPASHDQTAVIVIADPGIHSGAAAPQAVGIHPRVLQGSPARLQHQPLLWIQQVRLDRGNPEEGGVEQVDPVEVTTKPAGLALNLGVWEQLANAPGPGARNALCHGVLASFEQTPERRKVLRAGEPARHTHDCYRLCGLEKIVH